MLLFPNLKFAILDGITNFHDANLKKLARIYREEIGDIADFCELIVLSAARCQDFDFSISLPYQCVANLWYLDISFTSCNEGWFRQFASAMLPNLRVVKLQCVRLTDRSFATILDALGEKLWSLDISLNELSDKSLFKILDRMPALLPERYPDPMNPRALFYEDSPLYATHDQYATMVNSSIAPLRPDSKYGFIQYLKKYGHFDTRHTAVLEEGDPVARVTGITHLYLARNKFTADGIWDLLESASRLQVLDVGSIYSTMPGIPAYSRLDCASHLLRTSGNRLERLRIHHSIITNTISALTWDRFTEDTNPAIITSNEKAARTESVLSHSAAFTAFNPNDNHRITDLTLTGIPTKTRGFVSSALINLVMQCAEQEGHIKHIKVMQRGRQSRRSPPLLLGLRNLTLEFLPQEDPNDQPLPFSVSGDRDAENFVSQLEDTFSFFPEAKTAKSPVTPVKTPSFEHTPLMLDVLEELKKFRLTPQGKKWTGTIKIIRPDRQPIPRTPTTPPIPTI